MANVKIRDIASTATALTSEDYLVVASGDGATKKLAGDNLITSIVNTIPPAFSLGSIGAFAFEGGSLATISGITPVWDGGTPSSSNFPSDAPSSFTSGGFTFTKFSTSVTQSIAGHTHSVTVNESDAGGHTHTITASATDASAHKHNVSVSESNAGGHQHASGGDPAHQHASVSSHNHNVSVSESNAGGHGHTITATTANNGSHNHSVSASTSSSGGHSLTLTMVYYIRTA